jgi:hypothetical protein
VSWSSFPFVFESPFDDAICDTIGDALGSPFGDAIDDVIVDAIVDVIGDAIDDVTGDADESSSSIVQCRKLENNKKQKISKVITTRYFYVISFIIKFSVDLFGTFCNE